MIQVNLPEMKSLEALCLLEL